MAITVNERYTWSHKDKSGQPSNNKGENSIEKDCSTRFTGKKTDREILIASACTDPQFPVFILDEG